MPCVCCQPVEDAPLQAFDDLRHWTDEALLASLFSSDEVARAFHEQFPRFDAIVNAAPAVLARVPGVGRRLAERLLVAFELGARARAPAKDLREIRAPNDVYDVVAERFRGLKQELFLALLLDTKNRLMKVETVALGTLNASLVHPRLCAPAHKRGYVVAALMWRRTGACCGSVPWRQHKCGLIRSTRAFVRSQ